MLRFSSIVIGIALLCSTTAFAGHEAKKECCDKKPTGGKLTMVQPPPVLVPQAPYYIYQPDPIVIRPRPNCYGGHCHKPLSVRIVVRRGLFHRDVSNIRIH